MKMITPVQFMNEKKVGLLIRGHAKRPEDVPGRVAMINDLIDRARSAVIEGKRFIRRVDILIWANSADYPDEADCGELAPALRDLYGASSFIKIHEVRSGDLFCAILNYGIAMQMRGGCDYSVIASAEANPYWSSDVPLQMVQAACAGARAIGVGINELAAATIEGRISNTFAMWHNESLATVGLFDFHAAKPRDDRHAHYMKGTDADGNVRFYHLGGVEEMIPLARLVDTFGACIAPIEPSDPNLRYILPDPATNPKEWERHMAKFGTKLERQIAHLALIGRDLSHLRGGVMSGYGWKADT